MQRPAFTLSFKVSYPQYRDYYIYMKNAGKSPRVTPILLTVLALLLGVAALAVYGMTKNTRLSLSVTAAAVLLWVASLVLRLGWYIRVRRARSAFTRTIFPPTTPHSVLTDGTMRSPV